MLGLVFGHGVHAITAVLAAFMGGLARGSFLLARRARALANPVRVYGWLEVGIGVACALVPVALAAATAGYLALQRVLGLDYRALTLVQFVLVFVVLLVPTTCMGGTLPVLAQGLAADRVRPGRTVGALYALNTFGAVLGVMAAGYGLLPLLGNRLTSWLAATANLGIGALALWWSRRAPAVVPAAPAAAPARAAPVDDAPRPVPLSVAAAALGVSGAVSMLGEIAWTRALALVIGSSTYAFTAMLIAFLVGIAGGSALYSWWRGARPATAGTLGTLLAALGVVTAATVAFFDRLPEVFVTGLGWSDTPTFVQGLQLACSTAALLPSTALIGATFPCAVAMTARDPARMGEDVGHVYAANTLGAIGGVVLAGFALVPVVGIHRGLIVGAAVDLALAAALLGYQAATGRRRGWVAAAACIALAVAVFALPPWDLAVMSSGPAVYAKQYQRADAPLRQVFRAHELLHYRDGPSGTVSVHRAGEHVYLRVNGKTDASTDVDMMTQLMIGHLPMLTHPAPRRVLIIGLGSGITASAVARYPVERVDVVEIEPAVVEASRFFAHVHRDVLAGPRVHTVVADGRSFLLTTPERYDVIVSEPSNPWIAGLASLFTTEFFELARSRLHPGGVMLQWVQGYSLLPEDLRMVVRTFSTGFPHASVWGVRGDFLLLGRAEPGALDPARVEERVRAVPGVMDDLARIDLRAWPAVFGLFMVAEADVARYLGPGRLNTDDRLPLEFSAPRALYADTGLANRTELQAARTRDLPEVGPAGRAALDRPDARHWMGRGALAARNVEVAAVHFAAVLRAEPAHAGARTGLAAVELERNRPAEALALARQVLSRERDHADALVLAGLASGRLGQQRDAMTYLERAVTLAPERIEYRMVLQHTRARGRER